MDIRIVNRLTEEYDTPFFLYNQSVFNKRVDYLRSALVPEIDIFYSMKANPNTWILKTFMEKGVGVEVASGGELQVALSIGFDPKKVFFTAPGKTETELRLAISEDIFAINIDNLQEFELVNRIAAEYKKLVYVTFRIHQDLSISKNRGLRMTGDASQFGITPNELMNRLKSPFNPYVKFIGIHTFQGSDNFNLEVYEESWSQLIALCEKLELNGYPVEFIGLGGGIGYDVTNQQIFDLEHFKKIVQNFVNKNKSVLSNKKIVLESGNFLAREGGCYVTKVLYTKQRKDISYVFVDGGTHHIPGENRFSRSLSRKNREVITFIEGEGEVKDTTIVGKLCTTNDVLSYKNKIPPLTPGDLVLFPNCGAYALTSSRLQFLSHDEPAEIFLDNKGSYHLTRKPKKSIQNFCLDLIDNI
ncbi:hypothetical protein HPB58_12940 [Priestia filamentosa]|uniref:hypothetical protein n=1 Tax=Priestia filamentosa TaxID=1402861 RepID=UPI001FB51AF9|nr:hypothetical protein [Priestia filamentosa]UOE58263.1 hypothetical protein HPB58_12940 [Priestia filamentosa]